MFIVLYDPLGWDSPGERWTNEMRVQITALDEPVERLAETIVPRPRTRQDNGLVLCHG
jgi:hypothetical protein